MANYPSYDILLRSSQELDDGIDDDFSQAGSQHSRTFFSEDYYRFTIYHMLTLAEWNSLKSTYSSGPRDDYTFTYHDESPQVTYTVKFIAAPQKITNPGGDKYFVQVELRGTQD